MNNKRQILKVKIPYVGGDGEKPRPVIQLNKPCDEFNNFQVIFITSKKPKMKLDSDLVLNEKGEHFELTGLSKTLYIRCSKIFTIDPVSVECIIGELSEDLNNVLNKKLIKNLNLQ
jgi:PemK-like, MazF-like toxin of type II toxin-antitoxin system